MILLLAGCTASAPPSGGSDSGIPPRPEPIDRGPVGGVEGVVRDPRGGGLEGVLVAMCADACIQVSTDAAGAFVIDRLSAVPHVLHVHRAGHAATAQPMVPFEVFPDEVRELDVVLPPMPSPTAIGDPPAEVEVAPGLFVTLDRADVTGPFGDAVAGVAGVEVHAAAWPPLEGIDGTVLAVYYLAPYDAEIEPAAAFRVQDRWTLPADAEVEAWVAGYSELAWLSAGTLVDRGAELDGGELPMLTTLVLAAR